MYSTTTVGYKRILEACWQSKVPLYVYGGYGIGKSQIPRQVFSEKAEKLGLIYREWEHTSQDEKREMIANASKYFVFCDQRVGQMDSTDLRGIPNMMDTTMLQTIPYAWVIYFCTKGANGVILFDELNLAPPTVAGTAYQIINDRTISDRKVADNVLLIGAGNRECDKANVFQMPSPLKDRFAECEISVNAEEWATWASQSGKVNSHLISFINWKNNLLYQPDIKKGDKASTPRGLERASKLIGDLEINDPVVFELISISLGEAFASQFQAYTKYFSSLDWNKIYKNPVMVKAFECDKLYSVAGGMCDQFVKGVKDERFEEQMNVVLSMSADFAIVTLKMMKDSNKKKFSTQIKKCKNFHTIVNNHSKFIID
jgi:hypothetical protein